MYCMYDEHTLHGLNITLIYELPYFRTLNAETNFPTTMTFLRTSEHLKPTTTMLYCPFKLQDIRGGTSMRRNIPIPSYSAGQECSLGYKVKGQNKLKAQLYHISSR